MFADSVRKNNPLKDAFAEALKVSATLGGKPATWAGMPEIAALATLLQVNIRTLYPEGTALAYRLFFNSTFSPMDLAKLETKSSPTATIMWSCTGLPTSGHFEKANHFVDVLPTAVTKGTKRNPPTTLLHPFVKQTSIKGMLLHPNKQSPSSKKLTDYYCKSGKTLRPLQSLNSNTCHLR